jgi:glutamate racemase
MIDAMPDPVSSDAQRPGCNAPIGIFDSGVGGLSVARHLADEMPCERLLYFADSAYAPYGAKSLEEVEQRVLQLSGYLVRHQVKALVVACNTATAAAINRLRSTYSIPVIGMEPAVKPASALTRSGVVGILATAGTLESDKFTRLQARFGREVRIIAQPCPGLVEQVEAGDLSGSRTRELVQGYVGELLAGGADTLVLGCTHYPFLSPLIRQLVDPEIEILDTGLPVSREVFRQLDTSQLLADRKQVGGLEVLSSGDAVLTHAIVLRLWGGSVPVREVKTL